MAPVGGCAIVVHGGDPHEWGAAHGRDCQVSQRVVVGQFALHSAEAEAEALGRQAA